MLFLFIALQAFLKNKKERGKLLSIFINIELFYCHNRIETQVMSEKVCKILLVLALMLGVPQA